MTPRASRASMMPGRQKRARAPLAFLSYVGWLTIVAFVAACVAFQFGVIGRGPTLVVLAAVLLGYASIVSVLGRVL